MAEPNVCQHVQALQPISAGQGNAAGLAQEVTVGPPAKPKGRAPRQGAPRRRLAGSRKPAAAQEDAGDGICDVSTRLAADLPAPGAEQLCLHIQS